MAKKAAVKFQRQEEREDICRQMDLMGWDASEKQMLSERWWQEDARGIIELAKQYGIEFKEHFSIRPSDPICQLALMLARQLHPSPAPKARKKKWSGITQAILVIEIDRLARPDDPAHGVTWACEQLAKQPRWLDFLDGDEPAKTLRQGYYDFRKDTMNIHRWLMTEMFNEMKKENRTSDWEARVDAALSM